MKPTNNHKLKKLQFKYKGLILLVMWPLSEIKALKLKMSKLSSFRKDFATYKKEMLSGLKRA